MHGVCVCVGVGCGVCDNLNVERITSRLVLGLELALEFGLGFGIAWIFK